MNTPQYIIIADWQNYLCHWRSTTPRPKWLRVPERNYRYGNAQNVCIHSPQMETYLKLEGIRYTCEEETYGR